LETDQGTYFAHFWHHQIDRRKRRPHLRTEVRLHPGPCNATKETPCTVEAARAIATTHSRLDVFNKKVGRAIALDRVLKGFSGTRADELGPVGELVPRSVRAQIWQAYKGQSKLPESNGTRSLKAGH